MAKKPIDDLVSRLNDLDDSQGKGQHAADVDDQAAEMYMWIEDVNDNYQEAIPLRTEQIKLIDKVMERQIQNVNNILVGDQEDLEPDTLGQTLDAVAQQGGATAQTGADVKTELGGDQIADFAVVDEAENLNPNEDIGS